MSRDEAIERMRSYHFKWRRRVGLSEEPPRHRDGAKCNICVNACIIAEGGFGFCGVITNRGGKIGYRFNGFERAYLHYYFDPIPTNCVAAHLCPASTGCGYPRYAVRDGVESGYYNLAVFFAGCNLDCIFCQNIEHKYMLREPISYGGLYSIDHLKNEAMNNKVTCICYFGGDPTPHSIYSIKLSAAVHKEALEKKMVKRICWETNGLENPALFKRMAQLSQDSGGIVKVDWKAYSPQLYSALTGIDGEAAVERIKDNIKVLKDLEDKSRGIPLLVVSVLIVPHYVSHEEVGAIAKYLSSIDDQTPMVLLAFAPHHLMRDAPTTSYSHMMRCVASARENGIKNIHIGNYWLLR